MKLKEGIDYERGSGNVFADLDLPNPEALLEKSAVAAAIVKAIQEKRLTKVQAARILDVDRPKVDQLLACRLGGFTIDQLYGFLRSLDPDVRTIELGRDHRFTIPATDQESDGASGDAVRTGTPAR